MRRPTVGFRARLEQVQGTIKRVQAEGERVVGRIRKDAGELLSKTVKRQWKISSHRRRSCVGTSRSAPERRQDLEERGQRIVALIEKQAGKGVEPIVRSLNLPTRDEVEKLKKRLTQLEKRLDEMAGSKAA